jgi:putative ABC transport system permease protein
VGEPRCLREQSAIHQRRSEIGNAFPLDEDVVIDQIIAGAPSSTAQQLRTVLGVGGALMLTRYLAGMLFGLSPVDPITFAVVFVMFVSVAMLASYIPARRAVTIDPLVALREE